jgi:uncharacterized membrane protein YidH (DUF202 family)
MSDELATKTEDNVFIRFGYGVISFIVGLSAFYIIKLVFMVPINFMATPENAELMESVGAILLILAVYQAVKFTKNLNRTGTRKSRNIKRIITVILGVVCMIITTVLLALAKSLAKSM